MSYDKGAGSDKSVKHIECELCEKSQCDMSDFVKIPNVYQMISSVKITN